MANTYHSVDNYMEMECDACGDVKSFRGEYRECTKKARNSGWIIQKHGPDWMHFCSYKCKKTYVSDLDDYPF